MLDHFYLGGKDFLQSLKRLPLTFYLSSYDIKIRYIRSFLGPFWLTLNTVVLCTCLGIIFGKIFNLPTGPYLIHLSIGLIIWQFLNTSILESSSEYRNSKNYILEIPGTYASFIIQTIIRNTFVLLHNIIIIPFLFIYFEIPHQELWYVSLLGFVLIFLNLLFVCLTFAILATRFNDVTPILTTLFTAIFYFTPIIWNEKLLPKTFNTIFLHLNPFYHCLKVIRDPLIVDDLGFNSFLFLSITLCIFMPLSLIIHGKYINRIPYWL
tara:strand:+ start:849 stop:1646 length:798 start_codon:yes stop_codon:yes gene_type:complete